MLLRGKPLLDRRILFFGGKGGVGKTTLASAFALLSAKKGRRTLLVSTDPAHSTADILQTRIGSEPTRVAERLWAQEIDPAREADRYIADVKSRIAEVTAPRLAAEVERQIDIARISPGAEESALFERVSRIIDQTDSEYDRIVFDTAPTGHTLRLLSLPEHMSVWIQGLIGRREKMNALARMWRGIGGAINDEAEQPDPVLETLQARQALFNRTRRVLTDSNRTAFVFVVIPERLPIAETEKAVKALDKYHIPVGAVIVNRVMPEGLEGEFMARRREREDAYLREIRLTFGHHRLYEIPMHETDVHGLAGLEWVIEKLPSEERGG